MDWEIFIFSGITLICAGIFVNEFVVYHNMRFKADRRLSETLLSVPRHILRVLKRTS